MNNRHLFLTSSGLSDRMKKMFTDIIAVSYTHLDVYKRQGHNGAAFCLDANRDSPEFRDELDRFFRTVTRQGIHRILLDLGRNLGGTDAVINLSLIHI